MAAFVLLVTIPTAIEVPILSSLYRSVAATLGPLNSLPWVETVSAQSARVPLAKAHAVLSLAALLLILGSGWIAAIGGMYKVARPTGTDLPSLRSALRTRFPLRLFVPAPGWGVGAQSHLMEVSAGDQVGVHHRSAEAGRRARHRRHRKSSPELVR
jgi:hypothetical protein